MPYFSLFRTRPLCLFSLAFTALLLALSPLFSPGEEVLLFAAWEEAAFTGRVESLSPVRDEEGERFEALLSSEDGRRVLAKLPPSAQLPPVGSRCTVRGKALPMERAKNPGMFDAFAYYTSQGIAGRIEADACTWSGEAGPGEYLFRLRCRLGQWLEEALGPGSEEAAVLRAILLGEKGLVPGETKDLYRSGGIVHILAISGLHVSMIGMGAYRLLRRLPRPVRGVDESGRMTWCGAALPDRLCAGIAFVLVLLYSRMAGGSASTGRACVMFGLQMAAKALLRTTDFPTSIAAAALSVLLCGPLRVSDAGFWFSFAAVLSIALLLPAMSTGPGRMCAVALGSLPVYGVFYHTFPIWSVPVNLLVIPAMNLLFPLALLAILFQALFGAGALPGALCRMILQGFSVLCRLEGRLPSPSWTMGHCGPAAVCCYLVLLGLFVLFQKDFPAAVRAAWLSMSVLVLTFRPVCFGSLWTLDVGQGLCMVAEAPDGAVLIDGGSTSESDVYRYRIKPFLQYRGIDRLSGVYVTHGDWDHAGGILDLLADEEGPAVDCLYLGDTAEETRGENEALLIEAARARGVEVRFLHAGEETAAGMIRIRCLHPAAGAAYGEANEGSLVLWMDIAGLSALVTGDLEGAGEQDLLRRLSSPVKADVLQAAHHGSGGASTEEFLERADTRIAVISCGMNNRYGHPDKKTVERLSRDGNTVYDVRFAGAVRVASVFGRTAVRTFRSGAGVPLALPGPAE